MCDPASIGIASTVMQTYSGLQAANAQAKVAEQNARLAREQASAVEDKKARELTKINQQEQQTKGTQRAVMAANGVDSGFGSGLSALSDTAYLAQQDKNNTEINASWDKWALNSQAAQYDYQAKQAKTAGTFNAVGGVLASVGSSMAQNAGKSPNSVKTSPLKAQDNFFKSGYYGAKDAWDMSKFGKVNKKWYK